MNAPLDHQRIAGAVRFMDALSAVAHECAASGAWGDELTDRRRRRELTQQPGRLRSRERPAKAL
jgi:hypothetical protein